MVSRTREARHCEQWTATARVPARRPVTAGGLDEQVHIGVTVGAPGAFSARLMCVFVVIVG